MQHIVGQKESTIDFARIMEKKRIILIKLSSGLADDIRSFIGTLLISELLYAAQNRPQGKRDQFCIVVDEFQNFVTDDFAKLINEARKYGIATTIAHQERYGQLLENRKILGATSATANKVIFQCAYEDARELAPEFANAPPAETIEEQGLVISQNPVFDLLRGHASSDIRAFTDRLIRPVKERLEDIHGESEAERLIRTELLDTSNLFRLDERTEGIGRPREISGMRASLEGAGRAIIAAKGQVDKLKELTEESMMLRTLMRVMNRLFIAVMEGTAMPGQEVFSDFLVKISETYKVDPSNKQILRLYIGFAYGDRTKERVLPFNFAKRHGFFSSYINETEKNVREKLEFKKAAFSKRVQDEYNAHLNRMLKDAENDHRRAVQSYEWRFGRLNIDDFTARELKRLETTNADGSFNRDGQAVQLWRYCTKIIGEYNRGSGALVSNEGIFWWLVDIAQSAPALDDRVPDNIPAAVLPDEMLRKCRHDARDDLNSNGYGELVTSVDMLVELCQLLAKPENHVKVKVFQYVERQTPTRTIADMVNEMAKELSDLPRFRAYAKILKIGGQIGEIELTQKAQIQTLPMTELSELDNILNGWQLKLKAYERGKAYCRERKIIEAEIAERHRWKPKDKDEPRSIGDDEPPPIQY